MIKEKESVIIKWLNYGVALSVIMINTGFILPVTLREMGNAIPYADNNVLKICFNCNMLMIPAIISILKKNPYKIGWLISNFICLLVCIYVYFIMTITINAY